jgi:hypothetical protein
MTNEHKPCPWCKRDTVRTLLEVDEFGYLFAILCSECKCTGPLVYSDQCIEDDNEYDADTERRAWEAWDER